jgi:hypothetical protein
LAGGSGERVSRGIETDNEAIQISREMRRLTIGVDLVGLCHDGRAGRNVAFRHGCECAERGV